MGLEVGHADLLGSPSRGGRHDLHEAGGAHHGFGVHDETAFLADQAVHIGRLEANGLGTGQHRRFERHGETLFHVHHALGAFAGVDAAVPHFGLAGQVGRSQQAAVVHAAAGVQVGGVVPLAHALGAQAQLHGVQRTHQAGGGACVVFFLGRQGQGFGRGDHFVAQVFQGQHFVEALDACDALQCACSVSTGCIGGGAGQLGAGTPVDPGGVVARGLGHGGDGVLHYVPAPGAQGGAGGPDQVVFVHVLELPLGKVAHGVVREFLGGAFANHAPDPAALFLCELGFPAQLLHFRGGFGGLLVGQADERQRHEFAGLRTQRSELVVEVLAGVQVDGVDRLDPVRIQQTHGLGGDAQAVVFHAQAGAQPSRVGGELFVFEQLRRCAGTGFVGVFEGQPGVLHGIGYVSALGAVVRLQAVTPDGAFIVHAVGRQLALEAGPIAAAAQDLQPLGTQAVFLVGTAVTVQEVLNICVAGIVEPGRHVPIGRPGLQQVVACLGQQGRQALAVALFVGLRHVEDGVVGARGLAHHVAPLGFCRSGEGRHRETREGQGCQNG